MKELLETSIADRKMRRRRIRGTLSLLVVVLVVLGGAGILAKAILRPSLFKVREISVSGTQNVSEEEVRNFLSFAIFDGAEWKHIIGAHNMFAWPTEIRGDILRFLPRVAGIAIEKDYENRRINVLVRERKGEGMWCFSSPEEGEWCYWFDGDGLLFERTPRAEGGLILVVTERELPAGIGLGRSVIESERFRNVTSIFDVLEATELYPREMVVNRAELAEVRVVPWDGPALYFSLRFPASSALAAIQSLKEKGEFSKLEYLDFRVENRVYYK